MKNDPGQPLPTDPTKTETRARIESLLKRIRTDADVEPAKRELASILQSIRPEEIASIEQDLLADGLSADELHRMCDAHARVFENTVESDIPDLPPHHPVRAYLDENRALLKVAEAFAERCRAAARDEIPSDTADCLDELAKADTHYVRKENQLFPVLERNGFSGPSKVMWSVHNEIRDWIKVCRFALDRGDAGQLADQGLNLVRLVTEMVFKEEKILFPTALRILAEDDWRTMRAGDDEVGYVLIAPPPPWPGETQARGPAEREADATSAGVLPLNMGGLTLEQIDRMLTALPIELSFVDEHDVVRYYSGHDHRIFPRSPGVIGRTVQNCHPPKSVHMVEAILEAFREGRRDSAEFWMTFKDRFLLIRYFAVHAADGRYMGTLEVTQDLTELRKLSGEKRLLDWA